MGYRARCQARKERTAGRVELEPPRTLMGAYPLSRRSWMCEAMKLETPGQPHHYILRRRKRTHVPATMLEWTHWMQHGNTRIADTTIGGYRVSTIFLGLDHRFFGQGPPVLYESMVFVVGGKLGEPIDEDRYCTWDEAERGHARLVAEWKRRVN